ncbi:MAG: UDP-glucose 4-epimerase GalE [Nitrospinae bacterium]|nr:UDP-glucose 4-epimerase GalE [Nitrospinota bacterium]
MARVLVTGGAGYIGGHAALALRDAGHEVLVYDNLSTGVAAQVHGAELVEGDLADAPLLSGTMKRFAPDLVMHFAASIQVGESVQIPLSYYRNNSVNAINTLEAMLAHGVTKIIFSSTAAVYGEPSHSGLIRETDPLHPVNPYGTSKLISETMLAELSRLGRLSYVALRYFNVAGADPAGRIGFDSLRSPHVIPRIFRAALGTSEKIEIFGTDWPTPDGTCIRDYIHVSDLIDAHLLAMERLLAGGASDIFNVGYGHGFSVREVVDRAKEACGVPFTVTEGPRRPGDPARLVADSAKIRAELGWTPKRDDLAAICRDAWNWMRR